MLYSELSVVLKNAFVSCTASGEDDNISRVDHVNRRILCEVINKA